MRPPRPSRAPAASKPRSAGPWLFLGWSRALHFFVAKKRRARLCQLWRAHGRMRRWCVVDAQARRVAAWAVERRFWFGLGGEQAESPGAVLGMGRVRQYILSISREAQLLAFCSETYLLLYVCSPSFAVVSKYA